MVASKSQPSQLFGSCSVLFVSLCCLVVGLSNPRSCNAGDEVKPPAGFPFKEGTTLTSEQAKFLGSFKHAGQSELGAESASSTNNVQVYTEGQKLTKKQANQLYSFFKKLGYSTASCGWYCCDNNYGCNPDSPPP